MRASPGSNAFSALSTVAISASRSAGTWSATLNASATPMSAMTCGALLVPRTSRRRPSGGCFFTSTSSAWQVYVWN